MSPRALVSQALEFFSNCLSSQEHVSSQPGGSHVQTGEWFPGRDCGAGRASLGQAGRCQVYPASLPASWAQRLERKGGGEIEILRASPGHTPAQGSSFSGRELTK